MNFENLNLDNFGEKMYSTMTELYPICRSITGEGVRQTLSIIQRTIPINISKIPTGTKVFDWEIPLEWNIKDAYVKDPGGKKIIDFKKSNLHVLGYSEPINKKISLDELKEHIFTLPEYPNWIPYRTSYYNKNWGFCMAYNEFKELKRGNYEVVIDSELKRGELVFGEYYIKGEREEEILLSTYVCHPSMCNDNLSGIVLLMSLAEILSKQKMKYSYRFLFIPETIGAITWLSLNRNRANKIKYGLIATCVGDKGKITYKKTRKGDFEIDKIVEKVLKDSGEDYNLVDFFPYGSDERQFCSPGFNLPVGVLMRTQYYKFKEYHTSADDLNFISKEHLLDSLKKYLEILYTIANNKKYLNLNSKCEPQLGKRGLYDSIGGANEFKFNHEAVSWVLNSSDGENSLLEISIRTGIKFRDVKNAADSLLRVNLLKEV